MSAREAAYIRVDQCSTGLHRLVQLLSVFKRWRHVLTRAQSSRVASCYGRPQSAIPYPHRFLPGAEKRLERPKSGVVLSECAKSRIHSILSPIFRFVAPRSLIFEPKFRLQRGSACVNCCPSPSQSWLSRSRSQLAQSRR